MYNRYVRNDAGQYERISTPEPSRHSGGPGNSAARTAPHSEESDNRGQPPSLSSLLGRNGLLSGILDKLKLSDIDTGDLLLLVLLFLLFRDGGDDELLIALGLLLIL